MEIMPKYLKNMPKYLIFPHSPIFRTTAETDLTNVVATKPEVATTEHVEDVNTGATISTEADISVSVIEDLSSIQTIRNDVSMSMNVWISDIIARRFVPIIMELIRVRVGKDSS